MKKLALSKLALSKSTIRQLTSLDLAPAAGGLSGDRCGPSTAMCVTASCSAGTDGICPTQRDCSADCY